MYKLDWSFIYNSLFLISSYLCLVRIRRRDFAVLFADCACFSRFLRVFLHVYFYYSFKKQFQVILPKVQKITKITKIDLKKFHKIICDSVFFIEIFQHFFVFLRLIQIYYFSQQQSSKILFIVICWNKTAQKRNIMCLTVLLLLYPFDYCIFLMCKILSDSRPIRLFCLKGVFCFVDFGSFEWFENQPVFGEPWRV